LPAGRDFTGQVLPPGDVDELLVVGGVVGGVLVGGDVLLVPAVIAGEAASHTDAGLLLDMITGTVLFTLLSRPHMPQPIDAEALSAMLLHGVLSR
jgi:hypothetical protein